MCVYANRLCFLADKIKRINKFVIHFRHLHLHIYVCTYWIHCWQPATLLRLADYMNCDAPCGHCPLLMDGIKRVWRPLAWRAPAHRCYCHHQCRLGVVTLCADGVVVVVAAAAQHCSDWRLLCPWYHWVGRHFRLHNIFATSPPRRAAHRATVYVALCIVRCRLMLQFKYRVGVRWWVVCYFRKPQRRQLWQTNIDNNKYLEC